MKKPIATVALMCAAAAFADPEITAFSVEQNNSRVVTIDFTLSEKAIVTLDMTTNGVSIGADNYRQLHDAQSESMEYPANKVLSAGRHVFMWRSSRDWPGHVFKNGEFAVELKAWSLSTPPDYMVVDLATKSNRWFYATAADLPDGGIKTAATNDAVAMAELTNDVYRTTKLVMRRIPAAGNKWRMGSPTTESNRNASEVPHYVTLSEDYYIGIYHVTKWQMNVSRADIYAARTVVPYNNVSYNGIRGTPTESAYNWPDNGHEVNTASRINKFRVLTGLELDLPTEAQWEYACRAGTGGSFYDDSSNGAEVGWYSTNSARMGNGGGITVGLLKPNSWGIYDMHGNVWEWTLDQFQTHPSEPQIDPKGATTNMLRRVVKGGTFAAGSGVARSAARRNISTSSASEPDYGGFFGFRLCCPVTGVAE